jgi:hypothetical protein
LDCVAHHETISFLPFRLAPFRLANETTNETFCDCFRGNGLRGGAHILALDSGRLGIVTRADLRLRPAMNEPTCIGIGCAATDIVEGSTEEFVAVGGPCGNMLAILACLGWRSFPAIRMGHDWAPSVIRKDFAALGVDDTCFYRRNGQFRPQGLRVLAVASSERAALYNLETCAETHCQRPSIQCQLSVYLPAPAEPSDLT